MNIHEQGVRRRLIRSRRQRGPGARLLNPPEELLSLLLYLIQRPPAPLDSFQLIRIGGPKDLELPGLEKLDPHSEQTDEMSRVLYVVLVLPHHRFALLSHVATEVLVVELAKAVQGYERQSPD